MQAVVIILTDTVFKTKINTLLLFSVTSVRGGDICPFWLNVFLTRDQKEEVEVPQQPDAQRWPLEAKG